MLNKVPTLFSFITKKLTEHPFLPDHLSIGQDQMNQRGRDRGRIEEREGEARGGKEGNRGKQEEPEDRVKLKRQEKVNKAASARSCPQQEGTREFAN